MTQSIESMIEVLQAFKAGKKIEYSYHDEDNWNELLINGYPAWNFDAFDYRIAPEPKKKVMYLCFDIGGILEWVQATGKHSPDWIRVPSEDKEIEI